MFDCVFQFPIRFNPILLGVVFTSVLGANAVRSEEVAIGDRGHLSQAYTCPNKSIHTFCADSLLEETIEHYSNQSVDRDNLSGSVDVHPPSPGSSVFRVEYPAVLGEFGIDRYQTYIELAGLAVDGRFAAEAAGEWDDSWRLFLQLGFPMLNHNAVHLLHFPPDTVLETQDYFEAATVRRWGSILLENGVPKDSVELYQPVVDIAPVATKASAGHTLDNVYTFFNEYTYAMLDFYASLPDNKIRPVVGGGYPVRRWLSEETSTPSIRVLDQAMLELESGVIVPAIGANHPSFIWYASQQYRTSDPERAFSIDMRVMTQDLVAACWQVEMSNLSYSDFLEPGSLPLKAARVERECFDKWSNDEKQRVCELVYIQVYSESESEAIASCENQQLRFSVRATAADIETLEIQAFQRGELSILQQLE